MYILSEGWFVILCLGELVIGGQIVSSHPQEMENIIIPKRSNLFQF